ncbi:MAG: hypothetical protein QOH72_4651 [Solirubrobacteraceae bacterium]|jgi:hypothetical protein|nr:hypothetical protein [Solirubrobacteraceae bacterium]
MRLDETLPGFCRCQSAYTPHERQPYPYLRSERAADDPASATRNRRLRILAPLPVPNTFRNGLATERTPSVIKAGSDVRTELSLRHRNRQDGAGATDRRRGFVDGSAPSFR